jgi:hypothetical protein
LNVKDPLVEMETPLMPLGAFRGRGGDVKSRRKLRHATEIEIHGLAVRHCERER